MKNNNTPKRKRLNRKRRLTSSLNWIRSYSGGDIVKGYATWYGVDFICAIIELRINGVVINVDYENKIKESIKSNSLTRKNEEGDIKRANNDEFANDEFANDTFANDTFAYVAGFTSGGAPYGVLQEEIENEEGNSSIEKCGSELF